MDLSQNKIIIKHKKHLYNLDSYEVITETRIGNRVLIESELKTTSKKKAFEKAFKLRTELYPYFEYRA